MMIVGLEPVDCFEHRRFRIGLKGAVECLPCLRDLARAKQ